MKKILLVLLTTITLTACGNQNLMPQSMEYNRARINLFVGMVEVNITSYTFNSGSISVTTTDGVVYTSSIENIVLINE